MAQYGLVGKLIQKGDITGYFVVDESGKELLLSKDKIIQIAETGMLTNWEVTMDEDGEKHLYSRDLSIENLPNSVKDDIESAKIIGKIIKEGKHIGYICLDSDGNRHSYSQDKLWQLIKLNKIDGLKAEKYNGKRVVLSSDYKISEVPEYVIQ